MGETDIEMLQRIMKERPGAKVYLDNDCWCVCDLETDEVILDRDEPPDHLLWEALTALGIRATGV